MWQSLWQSKNDIFLSFQLWFSLSRTHEKHQTDKIREQPFICHHNRYAVQGKLLMHHSLPVYISSGRPIFKSKSTNRFFMTVQSQALCRHQPFLSACRFCHMDVYPLENGHKLCLSTNLRHSLISISTKSLFSSAKHLKLVFFLLSGASATGTIT